MFIADPDHPLRPVDWRYLRAESLTSSGKRFTRRDDIWIRQAVRYLRRLRHCGQIGGLHRLAQRMPVVHYAHRRFQRRTNARTWTLEARLLAGESDDQIAAKCGLAPAVVECYEAVYFNVRDALASPDYILGVVFPAGNTRSPANVASIVKRMAHHYGPILLDRLLEYLARPDPACELPAPTEQGHLRELATELQCRLALQAHSAEGDFATLDRLKLIQEVLGHLIADLDTADALERHWQRGLPVCQDMSWVSLEGLPEEPQTAVAEAALAACA